MQVKRFHKYFEKNAKKNPDGGFCRAGLVVGSGSCILGFYCREKLKRLLFRVL